MSGLTGMVAWVLTAATPVPAPGSLDDNPAGGGTPGFVGFLFTFVLALLVIGLAISLVRGMRRMEHNNRLREAVQDPTADPTTDPTVDPTAGPTASPTVPSAGGTDAADPAAAPRGVPPLGG